MTQVWLIAVALLLLIEFATTALTTIWFAGGALIALICSLLGGPVWLQCALFAAGSVVLLFLTRPLAVRLLKKDAVRTNADSLIGKEAVVTEKIDNLRSTGAVQVSGQVWTARSVNPEHIIEKDEIVMIRAIEGVKLIVGKRIS
ncbi:MAG: NfeD family protein [Lachnospiraceae bacterium]|jgi:membrane protein implicated in regulation of membrane protease activity|nr:NfeD family protein [Lachnospiraceae bacterium]